MIVRRAMSLIEVLAATALLAIIAAACVPMLQRAATVRSTHSNEPSITTRELAEAADEILADPSIVGLDQWPEAEQFQIRWPPPERRNGSASPQDSNEALTLAQSSRPRITVRQLHASTEDVDHQWLLFACDGTTVCRWHAIDDQDEEVADD